MHQLSLLRKAASFTSKASQAPKLASRLAVSITKFLLGEPSTPPPLYTVSYIPAPTSRAKMNPSTKSIFRWQTKCRSRAIHYAIVRYPRASERRNSHQQENPSEKLRAGVFPCSLPLFSSALSGNNSYKLLKRRFISTLAIY